MRKIFLFVTVFFVAGLIYAHFEMSIYGLPPAANRVLQNHYYYSCCRCY